MSEPAPTAVPTAEELGFDPAALRRRYAAEREKRLRADGNRQYREMAGEFAHYIDAPWARAPKERDPLTEDLDALIIGAGFGGLLAAVRLQQAGVDNVRLIDRAGDLGGTWYWNRYPGAQCDIESYIYMPLLEETGYMPTVKYAYQPEIFEHAQRIGSHFGLYERTCLETAVDEARWNEEDGRWIVKTDRGDEFRARFIVMSIGPFNRAKLPGIPGIEDFEGHMFHTNRWDYSYTGGSPTGGMVGLSDKRVGVIGTGCTAIQCLPPLAEDALQVYAFQRTPAAIGERGQQPTDFDWAKSLQPGWQEQRSHNFTSIMNGAQPPEGDLVNDGWTEIFRMITDLLASRAGAELDIEALFALQEIADFTHMNGLRERVAEIVKDPDTAERLKAWYGQFCKRPVFSDNFLPIFNRPNVELVDTDGRGVERISEDAVWVGGRAYPVDCLIFATGFEVGTAYTRRSGCEIYGRDGISLTDAWSDGMRTYQGIVSHGFPNLLHIGFTGGAFSANFTYVADGQAQHIAHLITETEERRLRAIEATAEAESEWMDLVRGSTFMTDYQQSCTPSYFNGEGQTDGTGPTEMVYPGGGVGFFEMLDEWRRSGDFQGLVTR